MSGTQGLGAGLPAGCPRCGAQGVPEASMLEWRRWGISKIKDNIRLCLLK